MSHKYTRVYLKGRIDHEDILNVLIENIDAQAVSEVKKVIYPIIPEWEHIHYEPQKDWISEYGFIYYKDPSGNKQSIFYDYENVNHLTNLDYYTKLGLEDMAKCEKTVLIANDSSLSFDILSTIAKRFGGWIDKNDEDTWTELMPEQ